MVVSELIIGGQKSGKSRRAEMLAHDWLNASHQHRAVLVATATAHDAQMRLRIAQHQADRAQRLPQLQTIEEATALTAVLRQHEDPDTLLIVDCLTLWLTNLLMPFEVDKCFSAALVQTGITDLIDSVDKSRSPVILVSNEIGLGLIPLGADVRDFVDTLGLLNQGLASVCQRVTLMAAGLPVILKGDAP